MNQDQTQSELLRSEFADDADMIEIVHEFVAAMPARVTDMCEAYESRQVDSLRRMAHQLKGASGGYGFASVGEVAARLEQSLKSLEDANQIDSIREQVDELVIVCNRITV